jgi:hypothetical protein
MHPVAITKFPMPLSLQTVFVSCFSLKLDAEHFVFAVTEARLNAFRESDHQTGTTIL